MVNALALQPGDVLAVSLKINSYVDEFIARFRVEIFPSVCFIVSVINIDARYCSVLLLSSTGMLGWTWIDCNERSGKIVKLV